MQTNFSIRRCAGPILAAVVGLFLAAANPSPVSAQQPAPKVKDMQGKTAGQFYKNVKVLKDVPAVDIHPAMEYITVALGVGCPYCHDMRKFDDDGKSTKRSARNMMQMMFAIDNTAFGGKREVTCYTCHRGAPIGASAELLPGQKPPMQPAATNDNFPNIALPNLTLDATMGPVRPAPGDPPVLAPSPNAPKPAEVTLPSADDVLSKYEQSIGGAAVKKASTIVQKGTVEMNVPNPPGVTGPPQIGHPAVEIDRKTPDKAVQAIQMPNGNAAMQGYDGTMGWLAAGVGRELMGGELQTVQDWAEFIPGLDFKEEHTNVRVLAADKVGAHDVYVVIGAAKNGSGADRLYFDQQSGLLVRAVTNMNSVLGAFPETTDFDDYRDVSGIKMAYTVKVLSPEGDRTFKFDSIEINAPVEDAKFQQPPPRPPAPGQ